MVKHEIYKTKLTQNHLTLNDIMCTLRKFLAIDEYVSITSYGIKTTLGKWSPIYNLLKKS